MQLRFSLTLGLILLSLVGCARFGIDNNSLAYKHTQTLEPLKVPENLQLRSQQSLYPAPEIDPRALEQAPNFENKYGNRFEMPRPKEVSTQVVGTTTGTAPSRPQVVTDGNGIPLVKVDGSTAEVWKYVLAALSTSNLTYKETKTPYQLNVQFQEQEYSLRLTPSGTSNTLGVYDVNNNFVDATLANELLALIYQNWPA